MTDQSKSLTAALMNVQQELKAPKNQLNKFGGYNYRSCEDILEAVKPLLGKNGLILTISDEPVEVYANLFIKATATVSNGESCTSVSAFARHPTQKKGMDDSQITGATSSYARKYALNGLFCIDDTRDADASNDHGKSEPTQNIQAKPPKANNPQAQAQPQFSDWLIDQGFDPDKIGVKYGEINNNGMPVNVDVLHMENQTDIANNLNSVYADCKNDLH